MTQHIDTDKPTVHLIGNDGNAFSVLGACSKAARKAGWDKTRVDALLEEMMSGDYNHLLSVAMRHFEVI